MRVGLFGGSFNPIHIGHLRAAEEDREILGLDLVYFVPAASPPHKMEGELASAEHRLQMVRLATKGNRHFMVSDVEIRRIGRSYTVDTARFFRATLRQPATLYLLMGADAFAELDTWKDSAELMRLCNLAVHTRHTNGSGTSKDNRIAAARQFGYTRNGNSYVHSSGQTLTFVDTTVLPISATLIRSKLRAGHSVRYLVPADVCDYIARHSLY